MGVLTPNHPEDLDVPDATFACPDLTTFCRVNELGLVVVGQRLEPRRAVLACRVVEPDQWCRRCGCEGVVRDTVVRRLKHRQEKVERRLHLLQGLLVAFLNLDEVIRIIRSEDEPRDALIARFALSGEQADYILDTRLKQLARLEEMKISGEQDELDDERYRIIATLGS